MLDTEHPVKTSTFSFGLGQEQRLLPICSLGSQNSAVTMKKQKFIILLIILNILAIGAFIIWYCNRTYPIIGHDYRLFMPYMIDSYLHQKINGLTIQWYTPSFAGGRPVYSSPEDLQFSLPQLLLWVVDPWTAILASLLIFIMIGFVATYYFLKRLLGLGSFASILGAVFFIANGFYFEHAAVGHITYQAFPLFAVIVVILTHPRLSTWMGGVFLSLVITLLVYSGIQNIAFFPLISIIFFPLLYLIKPSLMNWKKIFSIALLGGILAALLCGSKIYAIYSFMRFFPRLTQDNYTTNLWTGFVAMIHQLLGTMTLAPFYQMINGQHAIGFIEYLIKSTGSGYEYWELDASISPALVILLAGGAFAFLLHKPDFKAPVNKRRLIAEVCLILAIWLVIEFTLAKGIIYPHLRNLPPLSSLRGNVRYVCAFIFPLAVVGAVIFDNWTKNWKSKTRTLIIFILLDGIALGSLLAFRSIPTQNLMFVCDYRPMLNTYDKIRYDGETFPVKYVIPEAYPWSVFEENATNLIDPYNVLFNPLKGGYAPALHAGSVDDIDNGFYNMIDPTGYLFPESNDSSRFERIPVSEKAQFLDFINRRQPNWKLPRREQILIWTALVTLVVVTGILLAYSARKWLRFPTQRAKD